MKRYYLNYIKLWITNTNLNNWFFYQKNTSVSSINYTQLYSNVIQNPPNNSPLTIDTTGNMLKILNLLSLHVPSKTFLLSEEFEC